MESVMSDNPPTLPWSPQQWAALRSVVQEAAQKSRVASRFLPAEKASPQAQTVPANWMNLVPIDEAKQRGEAEERLQVRSGKTLHLTTISCKVYLRGSEIADPELHAAKSMVRRAAEVLARLEDAIVFNGLPMGERAIPRRTDQTPIVEPVIYDISGGNDFTGLLEAPDTLWDLLVTKEAKKTLALNAPRDLKAVWAELREVNEGLRYTQEMQSKIKKKLAAASGQPDNVLSAQKKLADSAETELQAKHETLQKEAENYTDDDVMCVHVEKKTTGGNNTMPVVDAVIAAVQKLERRGHFGPFAAVFGDVLFQEATSPAGSASVLPSQSILPFLQGGDLHRSSTIPAQDGVVIALGGAPVELVVGADMDIKFLQVSLEPRYVLRVYERFVLRIKELDAVCRLTRDKDLVDEKFVPKKANS
jgi:uncharacterized linocin/CFP29 family protein